MSMICNCRIQRGIAVYNMRFQYTIWDICQIHNNAIDLYGEWEIYHNKGGGGV